MQRKLKCVKRENVDYKEDENVAQRKSKRIKREDDEYKENERAAQNKYKRIEREDEEYKEDERAAQSKYRRIKRKDNEYKENERAAQNEYKRIKREDDEFKENERAAQSEYKRIKREDDEFKENERAAKNKYKNRKREDDEFKENERAAQSEYRRIKRKDDEYKTDERAAQSEYRRMKRKDDEYKTDEQAAQSEYRRIKREDDEYKTDERAAQSEYRRIKREDDEYKENERAAQNKYRRIKREDDEYKEVERAIQSEYRHKIRSDENYKNIERDTQKNYIEHKRQNLDFRIVEKIIDRKAKQIKRLNVPFRRLEKQKNKNDKRRLRLNELYHYREQYINTLRKQNNTLSENKLTFLKTRSDTPEHICCCCEGLFFQHSIIAFKTFQKYLNEPDTAFYKNVMNVDIPEKMCNTCYNNVKKGKIPKLATSNGLKFPFIPECIKKLSTLEERMVAPYINFMQIRALKPFALNPQLSLKGSVVNIAIEVNDMIQVLPRSFDQMATIQIKLKRHMEHATSYMNEVIFPANICEALKYLQETPLYKKHDIQIDPNFFEKYENNYNSKIDFIIDPSDITDYKIENSQTDKFHKEDTENLSDEMTDDEGNTSDNEVLLIDRNKEIAMETCIIAPGQNKLPVPWHTTADIDELSFPKLFAGFAFDLNVHKKLSYSDRVKSEARRSDRRSCIPTRILYMAKQKLEKACLSSVNICLKKIKKNRNLTAKDVLNKNCINDLIRHDDGFRVLKQIRSSPSFWQARKKDVLAMIRQLGPPTIFLTLSAAEKRWPELMKCLAKVLTGKNISIEQALNLSDNEKTEFIRQDPVTCARYYDYKINKFMKYLKSNNGPFSNYIVTDSYERVEFQVRGSPHEHIFLWLTGAPIYKNTDQSRADCIKFIDKFITCRYEENNPYMVVQTHKHTVTCNKGRRNKFKCRFNYPLPVMPRTMILEPMEEDEKSFEMKENLLKIRKITQRFYKQPTIMEFDAVLSELNMTEDQYIKAIRSSITRSQVYLKRNSREVGINCYNNDMLNLFEANMDIQFILNPYSCATYIINYISKVDTGLSKLLRETANDMTDGNTSIKEKLRKIANVFINSNVMSAQEGAYHSLGLSMSKSNRKVIFINTNRKEDRVVMLKSEKALKDLDEDSNDVIMEDIISKYSNQLEQLENTCLADYAALYLPQSKNYNFNENEDADDDNDDIIKQRRKRLVIRYRRYNINQDPENFYREQMMLFLP